MPRCLQEPSWGPPAFQRWCQGSLCPVTGPRKGRGGQSADEPVVRTRWHAQPGRAVPTEARVREELFSHRHDGKYTGCAQPGGRCGVDILHLS